MISDDQIRLTVARELNIPVELLEQDTALHSLPDFDSVELVMLIVALENIGVKMPTSEAANLRTFGDILALPRS